MTTAKKKTTKPRSKSPTSARVNVAGAKAMVQAAGYSATPLPAKLGIHESERVGLVNAPKGFEALLEPLPKGVRLVRSPRTACDLCIWFPRDRAELGRDMSLRVQQLGPRGIWVCWPKKASGVATDLDENGIRDVALPAGLVDFKVCAIDPTYSGLKLQRRKT